LLRIHGNPRRGRHRRCGDAAWSCSPSGSRVWVLGWRVEGLSLDSRRRSTEPLSPLLGRCEVLSLTHTLSISLSLSLSLNHALSLSISLSLSLSLSLPHRRCWDAARSLPSPITPYTITRIPAGPTPYTLGFTATLDGAVIAAAGAWHAARSKPARSEHCVKSLLAIHPRVG